MDDQPNRSTVGGTADIRFREGLKDLGSGGGDSAVQLRYIALSQAAQAGGIEASEYDNKGEGMIWKQLA
jgi:hypothetical protein